MPPFLLPSSARSSAPSSATPIFDEVDRWWRHGEDGAVDGGVEHAPEAPGATMLSFPGPAGRPRGRGAVSGTGPRHLLSRP